MLEMADSSEDHGHIVLVTIADRILVLYGTSGLNDHVYAMLMCNFNAVREREECIGRHHTSFQIKPEGPGFFNCLAKGIYACGLAYAACQQLTVHRQNDGVGFGVLTDLAGE